jgi:hypothetical protein
MMAGMLKALSALLLFVACAALPAQVTSVADVEKLPEGAKAVRCAPAVTDDVLTALAKRKGLEELNLYHCREITADGLAHLAALKSLRVLNLDMCRQLDDAALVQIGKLSSLEELNLNQGVFYSDIGIECLGKLTSLRSINIGMFWKATARCLKTILALPLLDTLELRLNQWVNDDALEYIADTKPGLKKLNLRECRGYRMKGFQQIARLSKLKWLDIGGYREFGVEVLDELAKLENLEHLDLIQSYKLRDADLPHLGKCEHLRFLGLEGLIYLTGECFAEWRPPALEHLELKMNELSAKGLKAVAGLKTLKQLYIWDPVGGIDPDKPLQEITRLEGLTLLSIWCDSLSDETVKALAKLPEIRQLELTADARLTDAGVAALAGLKKATRIQLLGCEGVSKQAIEKLRKALPGCTVSDEKEE